MAKKGKVVDGAWVFPDGRRVAPGDRLDVRHLGSRVDATDPTTLMSQRPRIDGILRRIPVGESPYFVVEVDPAAMPTDDEFGDGMHYCTASEILGTLPLDSSPAEVERWLA